MLSSMESLAELTTRTTTRYSIPSLLCHCSTELRPSTAFIVCGYRTESES